MSIRADAPDIRVTVTKATGVNFSGGTPRPYRAAAAGIASLDLTPFPRRLSRRGALGCLPLDQKGYGAVRTPSLAREAWGAEMGA